jgi:glycerate-2-kinase
MSIMTRLVPVAMPLLLVFGGEASAQIGEAGCQGRALLVKGQRRACAQPQ